MPQIKPLPKELQNVAIKELGEVPARIADDLQALKIWIQQQPHLKARIDDQFLIQFLRGCKYRPEKAKQKIFNLYAMQKKNPNLFLITDVDDANFRRFHNTGSVVSLPTPLNGCGPRIFVNRFNFSPSDFTSSDICLYCEATFEVMLMNDPYACINGVFYVCDFSKVSFGHSLLLPPGILMKLIAFYEKTIPVRIKAMCLINMPIFAQRLFKLLRPCFPHKLRQRILICGKNMDDLAEQVPRKYLPVEYGGENGSLDQLCAEYNKVWDDYRKYFKQNAEYGQISK